MKTKSRSKKVWIIVLSVICLFFVALLILPFVFKGKIMEIGKRELNKQLNANVDFERLNLSFIRSFPNASLGLKNVYVTGIDDFEGDTLLQSKDINLVVDLKSLFANSGINIKKIEISDTKVLAHILKDGRANWDIMKTDTITEIDTTQSDFHFKLQNVKINRVDIAYISDSGNIAATIGNLNLALKGDFAADTTLLAVKLKANTLNFRSGNVKLVDKMTVEFEADIHANLKNNRFTLANNSIKINAIPLSLNGWVQLGDNATDMDLTLNSERVDFKSILSLIPAIYSNSFASLKAEGKVSLSAFAKGRLEGDNYPAFDVNLAIADGTFQYPDLPKSVRDIRLDARITNPGGSLDNTVVNIPALSITMGGDPFSASGKIITPISDPEFNIKAQGKINLGIVKEVYPLEKGTELNGLLTMDVGASGKMSYIENNVYDHFKFGGTVNASDIVLKMSDIPHDVSINKANLLFNDRYLNLTSLIIKIGRNDLSLNGKVENYIAYALQDKTLKGDFKINSDYLNVTDFMSGQTEQSSNDTSKLSAVRIPKNLDLTFAGTVKELIYDQMNFRNANAILKVSDGNLNIQQMSVNAFGGDMILSGHYRSENPQEPKLDFDIDLKNISFVEIFSQVKTLQKIVPIFDKATGKFNTKLTLNTTLQEDMMPVLSSIISNGSFNTQSVALKDVTALSELANSLKLNNLAQMAMRDIALMFEIKDGRLKTKPFDIKIGDYTMNLGGTTGLDQTIDYEGKFRVPDKLNLGKFQNIAFNIGGTFKKPSIKLDLMNTLGSLIEDEKNKVLDKVDSAKNTVLDKGREARDKALAEARKKADEIVLQARLQGDKLIAVAQAKSDSLVAKASNPIAKELAKKGASELVKQAQKQADNLNKQAREEADKVIQKAESGSEY